MSFLLKVKPLGGVGQIGGNMTLIESANSGFIIDAGILFPREKTLGMRFLYPNFYDHLNKKIQSIIITHSHEDHIGAVGKLLRFRPDIKIYCSRFCYEILKNKFDINFENVTLILNNQPFSIDDIKITPIEIDHSTPSTFAFYIEKEKSGLFFSSDFKCNKNSLKTIKTLKALRPSFNTKKVFCTFLDSTSVKNNDFTLDESSLLEDLEKSLTSKKRVTLTMFASNVERLNSVIDQAAKLGKKVYLFGRAIHFYYNAAVSSGHIKKAPHVSDIDHYDGKSKNCIIIVSGCQGDFRSTLTNLSKGSSRQYSIGSDDLIVFSSSIIPGNERQVQTIYNSFVELGADIITYRDVDIHCSGHPGKKDIEFLSQFLPTTHHFPIHGESFLLKEHNRYAKEDLKLNSIALKDFDEVTIRDYKVHVSTQDTQSDDFLPIITAENNRDISRDIISVRRKLGEAGIVVINTQNQEIIELGTGLNSEDLNSLEHKVFKFMGKDSPSMEQLQAFAKSVIRKVTRNKLQVLVI